MAALLLVAAAVDAMIGLRVRLVAEHCRPDGRATEELALLTARASLVNSPVSDIAITPLVRHPVIAATAAEELTGCSFREGCRRGPLHGTP